MRLVNDIGTNVKQHYGLQSGTLTSQDVVKRLLLIFGWTVDHSGSYPTWSCRYKINQPIPASSKPS